jgi:predicted amidophosphoribosyltransferase
MGGFSVSTCAFCGRLFQSPGTNICPGCGDKLDRDFLVVREYIYEKETEDVSLKDITENPDVSEKTVLFLIKEGRLSERKILTEGRLTCAACGAAIARGRFCSKCLSILKAETSAQDAFPGQGRPERAEESLKARQKMHTYGDGGK